MSDGVTGVQYCDLVKNGRPYYESVNDSVMDWPYFEDMSDRVTVPLAIYE